MSLGGLQVDETRVSISFIYIVCPPDIFKKDKPPSKYDSKKGFFKQSDDSTDETTFDVITENFGLEDGVTWDQVIKYVNDKNKEHYDDGEAYKLFFLGRHGEGYHNIAPLEYSTTDWTCYWQIRDGNGNISWFDAELTDKGIGQAKNLSIAWQDQLAHNSAPLPQSYYVSPLRRTCQTFNYTWAPITNYSDVEKYAPTVKELARETYGIGTESERHTKSFIHSNWPQFVFEDVFTEADELWTKEQHESKQHRNYRANVLLNDIFSNDPNTVISVTTHHGFINSILKTANHRKFVVGTGQMIPVVIKASASKKFDTPTLTKPWVEYSSECATFNPSQ
ncbi:hypothetical protein CAAN1_07S03598 [[Candida] anglica]